MNRSVLAAVVGCAGLASAAFGQGTAVFEADSRWVITGVGASATAADTNDGTLAPSSPLNDSGNAAAIPSGGTTAILLTLQVRTRWVGGTLPGSTTSARYGNYGPFQIGFANGQAGLIPSTITRSGPAASFSSFARGDWGNFQNGTTTDADDNVIPTYTGFVRGASVGNYNASAFTFARGFRVFTNTDAALNNATGNGPASGPGSGDNANGRFDANGDITDLNLLRDDFQTTSQHIRFATAASAALTGTNQTGTNIGNANNTPWADVYRVLITSATPMTWGGNDLNINFDGNVVPAASDILAGTNWTLNGNSLAGVVTPVPTHTTISFGLAVPTPGAAALAGLGGLLAARRRR